MNQKKVILRAITGNNERILWSGKPHVKNIPLLDNLYANKLKMYLFILLLTYIIVIMLHLIISLIIYLLFYTRKPIDIVINALFPLPGLPISILIETFLLYYVVYIIFTKRAKETRRKHLKLTDYYITDKRIVSIKSESKKSKAIANTYKLTNMLISSIESYGFEPIKGIKPILFNLIIKSFPLNDDEYIDSILIGKINIKLDINDSDHVKIERDAGWSWKSEEKISIMGYINLTEKQKSEIEKTLKNLLPGKSIEITEKNKKEYSFAPAHSPY